MQHNSILKISNLKTSNIIGIIPCETSGFKYSSGQAGSQHNTYVKCSNIFSGLSQVQLSDENGSLLTGLSNTKPAQILLSVYFEDEEQYYNKI